MPLHHPTDEMLLEYAAGSLTEAPALVIAAHLALCPDCRVHVTSLEALGGVLLDALPPESVGIDRLAAVLNRLDEPESEQERPAPCRPQTAPILPEPLRSYAGGDADELSWRRLLPGVEEVRLPIGRGSTEPRLLRLAGGLHIPRHTHAGNELTLVLRGTLCDGDVRYARGDLSVGDASVDHHPRVEAGEPCLCLWTTDAPLRLTGPIGRLFNPLLRF